MQTRRLWIVMCVALPLVGCVSASRHADLERRSAVLESQLDETLARMHALGTRNRELARELESRERSQNDLERELVDARRESARDLAEGPGGSDREP